MSVAKQWNLLLKLCYPFLKVCQNQPRFWWNPLGEQNSFTLIWRLPIKKIMSEVADRAVFREKRKKRSKCESSVFVYWRAKYWEGPSLFLCQLAQCSCKGACGGGRKDLEKSWDTHPCYRRQTVTVKIVNGHSQTSLNKEKATSIQRNQLGWNSFYCWGVVVEARSIPWRHNHRRIEIVQWHVHGVHQLTIVGLWKNKKREETLT